MNTNNIDDLTVGEIKEQMALFYSPDYIIRRKKQKTLNFLKEKGHLTGRCIIGKRMKKEQQINLPKMTATENTLAII